MCFAEPPSPPLSHFYLCIKKSWLILHNTCMEKMELKKSLYPAWLDFVLHTVLSQQRRGSAIYIPFNRLIYSPCSHHFTARFGNEGLPLHHVLTISVNYCTVGRVTRRHFKSSQVIRISPFFVVYRLLGLIQTLNRNASM